MVIEAGVVGALAIVAMILVLGLWNADLGVPFEYGGDANFYAATTKTLDQHPWYLDTPSIGWPTGSQLYDVPLGGDNLQFALIKVLTLFTGWAQAGNVYFLLSFPLIAVSAYLVARRFTGFRATTAGAIAMLYAFLPYHFARGVSHAFLANYAIVPIAVVLILSVMPSDREPVWRSFERGRRRGLVLVALACVVVGSTATYYTIFTGLMVAAVGTVVALSTRDWRPAAWGAGVAATLAVVLVINLMPTLLYWQSHGANEVGSRPVKDSEQFGLRMSQLLLPANHHRVKRLASAAERARVEVAAPTEHGSALGVAGDVGLVAAVGAALAGAARRRRRSAEDPESVRRRHDLASLGVASLIALLLGVSGGLGHLVALLGFTYVRGWNRISIFIAFFALVALGHLIERARDWLQPRVRRAGIVPAALATLVVIGLLDQSPVHPFPKSYEAVRRAYRADAALVANVEARFGAGAAIFQMPVVRYPEEGPVQQMPDYDHLRGYLHSDALRWSYGATRGRQGEWLEEMKGLPPAAQVTVLIATGFDAIWLNRAGFTDAGESFEASVRPLAGSFTRDERTNVDIADLRPLAERARKELGPDTLVAIKDQALNPIRSDGLRGWLPFESEAGRTIRWARGDATIELTNPTGKPRDALLRFALERNRTDVTISWPGGARTVVGSDAETDKAVPVSLSVTLPPGTTTIDFDAGPAYSLPDDRRVAFRIRDPLVTDALVIESAGRLVNDA